MKILVSAAACTPGGKSEGAAGWNAVLRIAARHESVAVITHGGNRWAWDKAKLEGLVPANLTARFIGEAKPWHPNPFVTRMLGWTRYMKFTRQVLACAREWCETESFDLCHHVTYATWRVPSPLWQLPIPFVWGPIGGGSVFPAKFYRLLSWEGRLFEGIREMNTQISLRRPSFVTCIQNSKVIIAANEETRSFLAPYRKGREMLEAPVVYLDQKKIDQFSKPKSTESAESDVLRLTAGGIMEGRKGVAVALQALAILKKRGVRFFYRVTGRGPEVPKFAAIARRLGIEDSVEFHPGLDFPDYVRNLQESDIYFLPSLRETTPMTLLEAILAGCYPVVADASGAGEVAHKVGIYPIPVKGPEQLAHDLALELEKCAADRRLLAEKASAAREKAIIVYSPQRYDQVVEEAYQLAVGSQSQRSNL